MSTLLTILLIYLTIAMLIAMLIQEELTEYGEVTPIFIPLLWGPLLLVYLVAGPWLLLKRLFYKEK